MGRSFQSVGLIFDLQAAPPSTEEILTSRSNLESRLAESTKTNSQVYHWMAALLVVNMALIALLSVVEGRPDSIGLSLSAMFAGAVVAMMAMMVLLRAESPSLIGTFSGMAAGAILGAWIGCFYHAPYSAAYFSALESAAILVLAAVSIAVVSSVSIPIGRLEGVHRELQREHYCLKLLARSRYDDLEEALKIPEVKRYFDLVVAERRDLVNAEATLIRRAVDESEKDAAYRRMFGDAASAEDFQEHISSHNPGVGREPQ